LNDDRLDRFSSNDPTDVTKDINEKRREEWKDKRTLAGAIAYRTQ